MIVRTPRLLVAAGLALALALLATACGGDDDDGDAGGPEPVGREEITVVLDWTPNTNHAGLYLAQARGWYRDNGLDVRIIQPGDTGSLQALAAGRADVAVTVQEELVPARAQGVPVVAIAAVVQHNTSSLLSPADRGITRPRDLAGHTYGGFGGPLERALIDKLVSCDGGDPDAVKVTEVGNVDYRVGFDRGDYDTVWIFDGWDGIRLGELGDVEVDTIPFIEHTDCIPDWYTPMLATSEEALGSRRAALVRFMDATARGYREAMADPAAAAAALLEAAPELDRDLVDASARYLSTRYVDDPARWGRQEAAVWERFVAFLAEAGLIDEPIDVDEAYTNDLLPDGGS